MFSLKLDGIQGTIKEVKTRRHQNAAGAHLRSDLQIASAKATSNYPRALPKSLSATNLPKKETSNPSDSYFSTAQILSRNAANYWEPAASGGKPAVTRLRHGNGRKFVFQQSASE